MAQKFIDQTTIQPNGKPGVDAFTAFAIYNDNAQDSETRLQALESGASGTGQDVAALKLDLQQETQARQQADQAEALARQQADTALDARLVGDNVLINGDFDFWQRGTSFTGTSQYTADRWFIQQGGITGQSVGQHVPLPGEANFPDSVYTFRTECGANTNPAGAHQVFEQRVEDCRTFANKTSTLSFRVFNAGPAGRKIAVEFVQAFGPGGSQAVLGISPEVFTLQAGMNYIKKTVTLPSVSGKIMGSRHCAVACIWTTAGSDFSARTGGLGLQTGTLYFSQMKWESGTVATPYRRRPLAIELVLCYRYGEPVGFIANSNGAFFTTLYYKVTKRDVPTLTVLGNSISPATLNPRGSTNWFSMDGLATSAVASYCFADSEL